MVLTCNGFCTKKFYKYQKPDVRLLAVEKEIRQNEENSRQVSNFISFIFLYLIYIFWSKIIGKFKAILLFLMWLVKLVTILMMMTIVMTMTMMMVMTMTIVMMMMMTIASGVAYLPWRSTEQNYDWTNPTNDQLSWFWSCSISIFDIVRFLPCKVASCPEYRNKYFSDLIQNIMYSCSWQISFTVIGNFLWFSFAFSGNDPYGRGAGVESNWEWCIGISILEYHGHTMSISIYRTYDIQWISSRIYHNITTVCTNLSIYLLLLCLWTFFVICKVYTFLWTFLVE